MLETELWLRYRYSLSLTISLVPSPKVSLVPALVVTQWFEAQQKPQGPKKSQSLDAWPLSYGWGKVEGLWWLRQSWLPALYPLCRAGMLVCGTYLGFILSYINLLLCFGRLDLDLSENNNCQQSFTQGPIWPFVTHKGTWEQEFL